MNLTIRTAGAALLLTGSLTAHAVSVSLDPADSSVTVNDTFTLNVLFDTEGTNTVGGAFAVNYDKSAFSFVSATYDVTLDGDPTFADDPLFRVPVEEPESGAFNLGFGTFSGIEGSGKAAEVVFAATTQGVFEFLLTDPVGPIDQPFQEGATYSGSTVEVSPVPLPAAAWLLASAVLGMLGVARRRA